MPIPPNPRVLDADTDPHFPDRWSPRSFLPDPLTEPQLAALFEAARWAPSARNEQPWLFCFATTPSERARLGTALVEGNRVWALSAPLLILLAHRSTWQHNGQPNALAPFDCGAAWMALALEARRLGLHAHAMAGFDAAVALQVAGLDPEQYRGVAMIAVGRRGPVEALPEDLAAREVPSPRRPLAEVARRLGEAD